MYLRRHRNGWRVVVERPGIRGSVVRPTKEAARSWGAEFERQIAAGKIADGKTFAEAVERYVREITGRKRGAKQEALRLRRAAPYFPQRLAQIGAPEIAAWRNARLKVVSASSVRREAGTLRHLWRIARDEWQWIEESPWKSVAMPKEAPARTERWGWREAVRVLRCLGYRHGKPPVTKQQEVALAFVIALRTALRAGEVLQVSPTTLRGPVLTLPRSKTEDRPIKVPLTRRGAALCAQVKGWSIDVASLDALFRKARDKCLVSHLRFHDARATALTLLARKVDVLTLARISRHKDLRILQRVYYRETAEEIAARLP